jgi:hypothetical protein
MKSAPQASQSPHIDSLDAQIKEILIWFWSESKSRDYPLAETIAKLTDLITNARIEELKRLKYITDHTRKDLELSEDITTDMAIKVRLLQLEAGDSTVGEVR